MKHKILFMSVLMSAAVIIGCGKMTGPASAEQILEENTEREKEEQAEEGAAGQLPKEQDISGQDSAERDMSGQRQEEQGAAELASGEQAFGEQAAGQISKGRPSKNFSFEEVADREFYFSSGAGGWYTVLHIHGDGSFDGHYQDMDMGDSGSEYPEGTLYSSDFSGRFTEPVAPG